MPSALWRRRQMMTGPFPNEATANYVTAMSVRPDNAHIQAIGALTEHLIRTGVWDELDGLYLFAAHDAAAALINVRRPGTYNATTVNSPTFTVDRGYAGNGTTSYLNTNFTPSTAGGRWTLNLAHQGVWSRTNSTNGYYGARTTGSTKQSYFCPRTSGDVMSGTLNGTTGSSAANTSSLGHSVMRRSASTATAFFKDGASIGTAAFISTALTEWPLFVGALNTSGTAELWDTREICAYHWGGYLTAQMILDLSTGLQTYMTAVGA